MNAPENGARSGAVPSQGQGSDNDAHAGSSPEIKTEQISLQLDLAVDRVMAEGGLYDPPAAAWAVKQARGDLIEAIFLVRAFRNTLKHLGDIQPLDTEKMQILRRISGIFRDIPGGQIPGTASGPPRRFTFFSNHEQEPEEEKAPVAPGPATPPPGPATSTFLAQRFQRLPRMVDILKKQQLLPRNPEELIGEPVPDLSRSPLEIPAERSIRLQALARSDEGFLLGTAASLQREPGPERHPFLGELRVGYVEVVLSPPELDFKISIGKLKLTECVTINRDLSLSTGTKTKMKNGYGLAFGHSERKAISMALLDRALDEAATHTPSATCPARDQEFILTHGDNVQSSGFVEQLKLPQYVDFASELMAMQPSFTPGGSEAMRPESPHHEKSCAAVIYGHHRKKNNPQGIAQSGGHPRSSDSLQLQRKTPALRVGHRCRADHRLSSGKRRHTQGDRSGCRRHRACSDHQGFLKKTTAVVTTETPPRATIIQTRHRIPETPLSRDQIVVYQVAGSDPLRVIEPVKSRAARMHALQEYDDLYLKLYEDIAVHHRSPGTFDHPVLVNDRYMMSPSPIPRFDNPKLDNSPALHLFGAGREKRIYAVPPFTRVRSLAFEDFPPVRESRSRGCHRCGSTTSFLNTIIMDAGGTRRWICSDTEYCRNNMRNKTS